MTPFEIAKEILVRNGCKHTFVNNQHFFEDRKQVFWHLYEDSDLARCRHVVQQQNLNWDSEVIALGHQLAAPSTTIYPTFSDMVINTLGSIKPRSYESEWTAYKPAQSRALKCECGGTKANTTHATWCPVFKEYK